MSFVYFATTEAFEGLIKIGQSSGPSVRLKQLQFDLHVPPFVILAKAPGGFADERNVHAKFDHLRQAPAIVQNRAYIIGAPTEWFRAEPELVAFISEVNASGKLPIARAERQEVLVMRMRREGATFKQIGARLGVTRQRAHQIHSDVCALQSYTPTPDAAICSVIARARTTTQPTKGKSA